MTLSETDRRMAEDRLQVKLPEHPTGRSWADIVELRQKLRDASKRILSQAKAEERDLTEEETRVSDIACDYLQAIADEIESRLAEGRKGPRLLDQPIRPSILNQRGEKMNTNIFAPQMSWRQIFNRQPKAAENVRDFGEALKIMHHGDLGKLAELRTMGNLTGELGGFAVPEPTWAEIWDGGYEVSTVMDRLRYFPMSSNSLLIPGWDSEDQSKGKVGGVTGAWIGEGLEASRVTPRLRAIQYQAKKLGIFISCTSEVFQDATALSASLLPLMRNNLSSAVDQAVLTGSGAGEPTGILTAPATIAVTRTSAGTVTFDDLAAMMGRMLPSSIRRCVWIVAPSVFKTLVGLQVGAASGVLAMSDRTGATDFKMAILGAEVRISDKLPERGDRGDIILADLGYYGYAVRESGRFEKSNSPSWTQDVLDFRLILRCDGKPLVDSPITPQNGTTTLSPFVALE